jgi:hypothetical protein
MLDWSQIEKYYEQGTTAGYALALMESEKLFREILAQKKIPGKTLEQKVGYIEPHLSSPQSFEHARSLTRQLLELKLPKNIGKQTTEQVLRVYFTAITEASEIPTLEVGKIRLRRQTQNIQKIAYKFLLYLIGLGVLAVALSLLLADTQTGQAITQKMVGVSRSLAYRWLPIALAVFTFIVIGISVSLKRKTKTLLAKQHSGTAEAE